MRKTEALYGIEAREKLEVGVNKVYNAVCHTMGAKGRNVIYKKYGMPIVTNDGVSIAREIIPEDPYEYLGAESIKQSAEQTNYDAGDGTSSTIVLAKHMIDAGEVALADGYNPMVLRKEMEKAEEKIVKAIKDKSIPVTDLKEVAQVSVENDKLAKLVSDIVKDTGVDGSVLVTESPGTEVRSETMKGYTWKSGYVSPYMITNLKGEAVLEDPSVIITDRYMNLNTDLVPVLTSLAQKGVTNVLLVAENVEGELLQTIIANKQQGRMNIVAVRKPQTQEELEDLALITGATAVTKDKAIKIIGAEQTGTATRVVVTKDRTILVGKEDNKDSVNLRIEEIRGQIKAEDNEKYGDIEILKTRLSRLTGGVALIKVGAQTEAEQAYLKMKIDDAVGACKSALEEGIVAGGGTTLRDLAEILDDEIMGERVVRYALSKPYVQILLNAGFDEDLIAEGLNYNVLTGEVVKDMLEVGIVDPAKVVRCAVENSISTAKTLLTTQCAIVDIPEEKKEKK